MGMTYVRLAEFAIGAALVLVGIATGYYMKTRSLRQPGA